IRGRLDFLTPEFVAGMCASFGNYVGGGRVLVGRDTRTSGGMVQGAAVSGLLSVGCSVADLGVVPAPTVEFETTRLRASGAVAVTASHNPPEWNALKFVDKDGIAISKERGEGIEKIFEQGSKRAQWSEIRGIENYSLALRDHISAIKNYVDGARIKKEKLKLVLDCGNGTASLLAPYLFRELGCGVLSLNAQPDGFFPGRDPEPTMGNVRDLIACVVETEADAGIAWDGDGDRVIFVDEKGCYVIGDKVFALCADSALARKKGDVVTTVATSDVVRDIAKKHGSRVVYTKVGGPYISEKMREMRAVVGGEEVGGVIWPDVHLGKDGFITAAKIVEAMARSGEPLSKLVARLPAYFNAKTKIPCAGEKKLKIMRAITEKARKEGREVVTLDGARINYPDGWCIARPSGTEDYIRIFAEAKSCGRAEGLVEEWSRFAKREIG
ncbi:MAG: phosphoglucosamine mutase, partial [Candidatus Micrarchaeota archaeon]